MTAEGLDPRGGAKAAAQMWADLGIPDSAITLVGGRNTYEEAGELGRLLAAHAGERVGLLTSAWHLKRAVRLATSQGLDVISVPADFRTTGYSTWKSLPVDVVPSPDGFMMTTLAMKEFLAGVVRR